MLYTIDTSILAAAACISDESVIEMSACQLMKLSAETGKKAMISDCGDEYPTMECYKSEPAATVELNKCYCNTTMCNGEFDFTRISQRLFCTVSSENTNLYVL